VGRYGKLKGNKWRNVSGKACTCGEGENVCGGPGEKRAKRRRGDAQFVKKKDTREAKSRFQLWGGTERGKARDGVGKTSNGHGWKKKKKTFWGGIGGGRAISVHPVSTSPSGKQKKKGGSCAEARKKKGGKKQGKRNPGGNDEKGVSSQLSFTVRVPIEKPFGGGGNEKNREGEKTAQKKRVGGRGEVSVWVGDRPRGTTTEGWGPGRMD